MSLRTANSLSGFLLATATLAHIPEDDDDDLSYIQEEEEKEVDEEVQPLLTKLSNQSMDDCVSENEEQAAPTTNIITPERNPHPLVTTDSIAPTESPHVISPSPPRSKVEETIQVRIPLDDDETTSPRYLHLLQAKLSAGRYKNQLQQQGDNFALIYDGGLGMLRYLLHQHAGHWQNVTLLDIGAGTGVVGLGVAAASKGKAVVAVTDMREAMPGLEANIYLNESLWTAENQGVISPLEWGIPMCRDRIRQYLKRGRGPGRVIITGADVVYDKSLFEPLLSTLCELYSRARSIVGKNSKEQVKVECLLACHSIRPVLDDFWRVARKNGFSVERIAIVELDKEDRLQISKAKVTLLDKQHGQLPPVTQTKRGEGVVWIVHVRKMPYTFSI